ncbi:hypothetical protein BGZ94_004050 [Podila epigama]|nr:hypothetical protein BGZ94_004050 [Podila epigama]
MSIPSNETRTPPHLRPSPTLCQMRHAVLSKRLGFKTDFLTSVKPKWWTAEGYLAHGYLDWSDLRHDLLTFAKSVSTGIDHAMMKTHCLRYYRFLNTDDGERLLRYLKAKQRVSIEKDVATMNAAVSGFRSQAADESSSSEAARAPTADSSLAPVTKDVIEDEPDLENLDTMMEEPWRTLTIATINKMNGHCIENLQVPDADLTDDEHCLLNSILSVLRVENPSTNDFGVAMTALSGIRDLRQSHNGVSAVEVPKLGEVDEAVSLILQELSRYLKLGVSFLLLKCDVMLGEFAKKALEEDEMPDEAPATAIEQETCPVSETEIVTVWKTCLETLSSGKLKLRSGEYVSRATAAQKKLLSRLYKLPSDTESGRKVDLLMMTDGMETLCFEAKASGNITPCERQYQKVLRTNHAIYIASKSKGITLPAMHPLDIRGMVAMICTIRPHGNIFYGGSAYPEVIQLPRSKAELMTFMSGSSVRLLWNYARTLVAYDESVREQVRTASSKAVIQPTAEENDEEEEFISCTPPQEPPTLKIGGITMLTPKASRKRHLELERPVPLNVTSQGPSKACKKGKGKSSI